MGDKTFIPYQRITNSGLLDRNASIGRKKIQENFEKQLKNRYGEWSYSEIGLTTNENDETQNNNESLMFFLLYTI